MEKKKKIYQIEIEEILQEIYDIEASSIEEAIEIAKTRYNNEVYVLDYNAIKQTNFKEIKSKEKEKSR